MPKSAELVLKHEFPLVVTGYPVLCKIVPPMQLACATLIKLAKANNYDRVVIFGSSTTWNFTNFSDLDICIYTNLSPELVMKQVASVLDVDFDLVIWRDTMSTLLQSEICKGVTIYARSTQEG